MKNYIKFQLIMFYIYKKIAKQSQTQNNLIHDLQISIFWFSRLNDFTLVILGPFIACYSLWAKALCWRLQLVLLIVQTECGDRDSILIYLKKTHLSDIIINSPSLALSTAGSWIVWQPPCSLRSVNAAALCLHYIQRAFVHFYPDYIQD